MDLVFSGFVVLLFAAVILLIEGAWLWWSGTRGSAARRIAQRLQLMSARGEHERVTILKQRRYSQWPALERALRTVRQAALLDRLLLQAGVRWSLAQLLGSALACCVAAMALLPALNLPFGVALAALAGAPLLPLLLLLRARSRRLHKLEEQLPEAADFLARALRAGHSFVNVMQMVGEELPDPIAAEFRFAYEEINYGVPMGEALHNLALRVPLTDLRYLVIAVLIQRESGGNLAEILGNISRMIRARLKLMGQVRVLSAEGRMSAWVLGVLPLAVGLLLSVVNPRYISILWTDPIGVRLLWYAALACIIGVIWMRSVIRIRV